MATPFTNPSPLPRRCNLIAVCMYIYILLYVCKFIKFSHGKKNKNKNLKKNEVRNGNGAQWECAMVMTCAMEVRNGSRARKHAVELSSLTCRRATCAT